MSGLRIGSLFSGVGGLDLAVEDVTGGQVVWQSEIEPGPVKVLEQHWPGVPNHGDITAIDWTSVEPVDVLCGGFPCQDISTAGLGAGIKEGTRSGLWYRYADAVRVLRPRYVFVENVAALLVRGLDIVAASLAELGYVGSWCCLRASDVGAPHGRNRLWLVAVDPDQGRWDGRWTCAADGAGNEREARLGRVAGTGAASAQPADLGHEWAGTPRRRGDGSTDSRGPTPDADSDGSCRPAQVQDHGIDARPRTANGSVATVNWGEYAPAIERWARIIGRPAPAPTDERGRLNPALPEWMMGYPQGWVTDHLGRTAALKAIGNGVCPQQAVAAFSALASGTPGEK